MISRRYRLVLLAVKIVDLIISPEYDVDDNLHCKRCCRVCNQGGNDSKYKHIEDVDSVKVKW